MNVLLIGGGGREHAIAWKLRQSPLLTQLYVAPGNAGTAECGTNVELRIPPTGAPQAEIDAFLGAAVTLARNLKADLVFVAPDDPLAWGLVDRLQDAGIAAFGPTAQAARIEASKVWAEAFMVRHNIPHPASAAFDDPGAAREYVKSARGQLVVKADGLAAGKGAIVTSTDDEALQAIDQLMRERRAGAAGQRILIMERLRGREVSAHAFSDGKTVVSMPLSCDHKAIFDGDQGPNTGGMGAYSPPWWAAADLAATIEAQVTLPAIAGLEADGNPFRGILYPGLFVTGRGVEVIEFNARFGDPETQVLLPRLKTDLLEIVMAAANQRLSEIKVEWLPGASVCVVLASGGYPGQYGSGLPISGLHDLDSDVTVFHAGTRRLEDGRLVTAGGRVLSLVVTAPTLEEARARVYANVERVHFEGMHYRRDIGR